MTVEAPGPAVRTLRAIARTLSEQAATWTGGNTLGAAIESDPDWQTPESTIRHIDLAYGALRDAVTAEIGAPLGRNFDDWTPGDRTPRIVTATPDEFAHPMSWPETSYAWPALAEAHRAEAGWDLAPDAGAGTWLGWWEPETAWTQVSGGYHVRGMLTGFAVINDERTLLFLHVVTSRRRRGIARALIDHARPRAARGPFTPAGRAIVDAVGLATTGPDPSAPSIEYYTP